VVVAVLADIVEIVVLATGADDLLGVDSALQVEHGIGLVDGAQEDGLELVHARIGEEQGRVIVRDDGTRGHLIKIRVSAPWSN
jgi:hypothetical protein